MLICKMSDYNKVETKWNADSEKFMMIMDIEKSLEESFLSYDLDNIYNLLRAYRRQTNTKFIQTSQEELSKDLNVLSNLLSKFKQDRTEINKINFYLYAEDFFLKISQALKKAGVYFREGKDASNAVLER